jgi:hypothetical protein
MLFSTAIFVLLSFTSLSLAERCPKIVTQKPFDITKVGLFLLINKIIRFLFSMLVFGMKLIEMIFCLKLDRDVLMQHTHLMPMEQ